MNLNSTIIGQLISFIFFVFFCMKYLWPKLISIIESRKIQIENDLLFIENSKIEINKKIKISMKEIEKSKKRAFEIIENAKMQSSYILEKAILKAEDEKNKIINKSYDEIEHRKKIAFQELNKKISILAISISKKAIESSFIKHNINDNMINKIISDL
ncbi:F0F1 ATP synthase subunit B [Buchnera aphidicola (Neophyllaphis podocarpi)]|uniref:F0F1 ATP synthase subunit B n=1 Tax=Buchnera aphidicola TaxID=9 RepID=UPI0031B89321